MVYDCTEPRTYENIRGWVDSINQKAEKGVPKLIVCNKIDLQEDRQITKQQGEELAKQYGLHYHETSAKNNIGISECMNDIFQQTVEYKY